jgi:hypothetical protein
MQSIFKNVKNTLFSKLFIAGFLCSTGLFSKFIFGNDNLIEQFSEQFLEQNFNIHTDFSQDNDTENSQEVEAVINEKKDSSE